jgi:hypothetical protein
LCPLLLYCFTLLLIVADEIATSSGRGVFSYCM